MAGKPKQPKELARVEASPGRRGFAVTALCLLAVMLLWIGFQATGTSAGGAIALLAQAAFISVGLGALWVAMILWKATSVALVLNEEGLADENGRVLAAMEDIDRVDRGLFAFKPSNGFLLILKSSQPLAWQPGLWWRLGKRIGIGGVCNGGATRAMADILSMHMAEKKGVGDGL